jgi:hypothetical protein
MVGPGIDANLKVGSETNPVGDAADVDTDHCRHLWHQRSGQKGRSFGWECAVFI